MICEDYAGFQTEAECLLAFEFFRWAKSELPPHPVASIRARPKRTVYTGRSIDYVGKNGRTYSYPDKEMIDCAPIRRPTYRCRKCGGREFYRSSRTTGTWDFFKRKCVKRNCGCETSLTTGTAFEGMKLKPDRRMKIIFSGVFARFYRNCDDTRKMRQLIDPESVSYNTAAKLLDILSPIRRWGHITWQWEFSRLVNLKGGITQT